jgi:hypothetical protein
MAQEKEQAVCRGCGLPLKGHAYMYGGDAYHPRTGDRCNVNFYGGYVCSEDCDRRASRELEADMPGGPKGVHLSSGAQESLRRNWY